MNKNLRTLAAVPVIAVIGAGCGSSTPDETGAASNQRAHPCIPSSEPARFLLASRTQFTGYPGIQS
jgi:hypothetical protein